jgi:hypothetical protein
MSDTIDAFPTFVPWYGRTMLRIPKDPATPEEQRLRAFARQCRVDRIKANVEKAPSVSMFVWEERAA